MGRSECAVCHEPLVLVGNGKYADKRVGKDGLPRCMDCTDEPLAPRELPQPEEDEDFFLVHTQDFEFIVEGTVTVRATCDPDDHKALAKVRDQAWAVIKTGNADLRVELWESHVVLKIAPQMMGMDGTPFNVEEWRHRKFGLPAATSQLHPAQAVLGNCMIDTRRTGAA